MWAREKCSSAIGRAGEQFRVRWSWSLANGKMGGMRQISESNHLLGRIAQRAAEAGAELMPARVRDVERAEASLGFPLPMFLRRLYLEVGDGGYGPGLDAPIRGYTSGLLYPLSELVRGHGSNTEPAADLPFPPWPTEVLQFADLGCFSSIAVDCRGPEHPVLMLEDDVAEVAPEEAWTVVAPSVEDWFRDWVDERETPNELTWTEWHSRIPLDG